MKVNIIIFGQLRDVLGEQLEIADVSDITGLKTLLHEQYPAMNDSSYVLAVDKKLVTANTGLTENCTVAILSAFSGG